MLKNQEGTCRVIDTRVTIVGKENTFDGFAFGNGDYVFALADLVTLDVLDRVEELGTTIPANRTVSHCQDIVSPGGASDRWRRFLAVDSEGRAVQGEDADIVRGCCHYNIGVAEGDC